jgi:drug/metabolite transporter (DMT)-like permease
MSSTSAAAAATRRAAVLAIVAANVIGGLSYPAQKAALAGLPPATVTVLRGIVALVPLALLVRARPTTRLPWTRGELGRLLALGTLAYAMPMWLGIVGMERSSAANASILILLEPVTILVLAWLLLGERVGPLKLAIVVLGLAGALVIVLEKAALGDLLASERFQGNALLALHGVLWGLHTPLAKPLSERHDSLRLCLGTTVVGVVALAPVAWLERGEWHAGPELAAALGWTVALGLFVSFGSVWLWLWSLRTIPASSVAGFVFLQPLAGVLAGIGLLGERLTSAALLGGGLIVAAVALDVVLTLHGRRRTGNRAAAAETDV